jgi:CRISPR/Cas system-associated exonuclease Cas4 (RecB family)
MSEELIEPKKVSYSQYSTWLTCPKQWKLKYVDKLDQFSDSMDTVFGTAMHEVIQEWLHQHFENEKKAKLIDLHIPFKDRLKELFKERSILNEQTGERTFVADKETLIEYYLDGCAILDHVRSHAKAFFPTQGHKLVGCEIPLEVQLNDHINYIGYIDLVIHDTTKDLYYIYDLKTSRSGWVYQKKDPKKINQILLYKKFYAEQFGVDEKNIIPRFLILKRKIAENADFTILRLSKFEPSHGTPSINKAWSSFQNFLEECFTSTGEYNDQVVATPSKSNCKYCPFRNTIHCTEGV